jgi:hypothetical protein
MWEKYPPVTIRKGLIAYFRYSIECGIMSIQKYIDLYFNKILQKRVANAIQTSRLFSGDYCTGLQTRLADAINLFIGEKLC